MLPHTSVMVCAFKVEAVELLVEVLLFLVLEFYFLIYTEPDGVGFSSSILLCVSVDFKADVFRSQMVVPAYFIKPYSDICFQQLQLGILVDVVRFCLLGTRTFF
jgi:hypothetical protein